MQDPVSYQFGRGLAKLIAKEEHHDSLSRLLPGIPCRHRPETTWDVPRFCRSEQESSDQVACVVLLERLKCADETEEKQLEREPFAGTDFVEDHV